MCDAVSTLQTSFILGALSLVPGNTSPYITIGLASVLLAVYAVHHYGPTQRLARLEDAIMATETILEGAKLDCARDHMTLVGRGRRLLEAKLSASNIQTKILQVRDGTWEEYFQAIKEIMEMITECAKDVKAIQTSTLVTIEAERQRRLSEGIKESHEVFNAVVRSPTPSEPALCVGRYKSFVYVSGLKYHMKQAIDRARAYKVALDKIAEARYQRREARTRKPQPWVVCKLMVVVTLAIMGYTAYVYGFRAAHARGAAAGGRRAAGRVVGAVCVDGLGVIITPPGNACDYSPKTPQPLFPRGQWTTETRIRHHPADAPAPAPAPASLADIEDRRPRDAPSQRISWAPPCLSKATRLRPRAAASPNDDGTTPPALLVLALRDLQAVSWEPLSSLWDAVSLGPDNERNSLDLKLKFC
ncbi:hypothetical protein B0H17DRAFT_1193961 [Mycena rosella]|uniref:Uncharacterized protein n=1 Tax=Mycena rosella TaxID=1033263 RepID=A0AAD7GS32_MYCRO|nr:hypothetical protein B0H17DRAFT_1193961 [Mycena rosella]